jgi:hypothetical protein
MCAGYCHPGTQQIIDCTKTDFYAPLLMPDPGGQRSTGVPNAGTAALSVEFMLSSFVPYQAELMSFTLSSSTSGGTPPPTTFAVGLGGRASGRGPDPGRP